MCRRDVLDHLQDAALDIIRSARVFLDSAERFVSDRARFSRAVDGLGSVAATLGRAAESSSLDHLVGEILGEGRGGAGRAAGARGDDGPAAGSGRDEDDGHDPDDGVQTIPVT